MTFNLGINLVAGNITNIILFLYDIRKNIPSIIYNTLPFEICSFLPLFIHFLFFHAAYGAAKDTIYHSFHFVGSIEVLTLLPGLYFLLRADAQYSLTLLQLTTADISTTINLCNKGFN